MITVCIEYGGIRAERTATGEPEPVMRITELDLMRADADVLASTYPELITPELWEEQRLDWEYWLEAVDCCGGKDWACSHYGATP